MQVAEDGREHDGGASFDAAPAGGELPAGGAGGRFAFIVDAAGRFVAALMRFAGAGDS